MSECECSTQFSKYRRPGMEGWNSRPMSLASIALDETMATSGLRQDAGSTRTSEQLGGYARTLLLSLTLFGKKSPKVRVPLWPSKCVGAVIGGWRALERVRCADQPKFGLFPANAMDERWSWRAVTDCAVTDWTLSLLTGSGRRLDASVGWPRAESAWPKSECTLGRGSQLYILPPSSLSSA